MPIRLRVMGGVRTPIQIICAAMSFLRPLTLATLPLILLTVACDTDDVLLTEPTPSAPVTGVYRLSARLLDPGDGSGTFQAVDSEQTLTLSVDSTLVVNEDICALTEAPGQTRGRYTANGIVVLEGCPDLPYRIDFFEREVRLSFPCFEPCINKYVLVD